MLKPHWKCLLAGYLIFILTVSGYAQTPSKCHVTGPQNILVILADYQGALTALPSLSYLKELFQAPSPEPSIADFLQLVSGRLTTIGNVTFLGPYHVNHVVAHNAQGSSSIQSTMDNWKHEVASLAARDIDLSNFERLVLFTPPPLDLSGGEYQMGAGAASNFCDFTVDTAKGKINLAQAWIRADRRYGGFTPQQLSNRWDKLSLAQRSKLIRTRKITDMQPIMHEIGHTFGLGHANRVQRPSVFKPPFSHDEILPDTNAKLYQVSYGDIFSTMSSSAMGWLSIVHLESLGWLLPKALAEVRSKGTYRIYPLSSGGASLKGLKIPRVKKLGETTNAYLWVEYRQPQSIYEKTEPLGQMKTDGPLVYYTNPDQPSPQGWWYPNETLILNFAKTGYIEPAFETDYTLKGEWRDAHSLVGIKTLKVVPQFVDVEISFNE